MTRRRGKEKVSHTADHIVKFHFLSCQLHLREVPVLRSLRVKSYVLGGWAATSKIAYPNIVASIRQKEGFKLTNENCVKRQGIITAIKYGRISLSRKSYLGIVLLV